MCCYGKRCHSHGWLMHHIQLKQLELPGILINFPEIHILSLTFLYANVHARVKCWFVLSAGSMTGNQNAAQCFSVQSSLLPQLDSHLYTGMSCTVVVAVSGAGCCCCCCCTHTKQLHIPATHPAGSTSSSTTACHVHNLRYRLPHKILRFVNQEAR